MNPIPTSDISSLLSQVKLPEDIVSKKKYLNSRRGFSRHRNGMLENGLEISEQITPSIESCLNNVCDKLSFDRKKIFAFILNNTD